MGVQGEQRRCITGDSNFSCEELTFAAVIEKSINECLGGSLDGGEEKPLWSDTFRDAKEKGLLKYERNYIWWHENKEKSMYTYFQ